MSNWIKELEKIENEIKEKQLLIENIKNFDNLSLVDKIDILKQTELDTQNKMIPIVLKDFKSEILRNSKEVYIDSNYFVIKLKNFNFNISLYSEKSIRIKTTEKLLPEETVSSISKETKDLMKIVEEFINNPSFSNYKKILNAQHKKISFRNYLYYYSYKGKDNLKKDYESSYRMVKHYIKEEQEQHKKQEEIKEKNKELKKEIEIFKESIKEDIDYFKLNGYNIHLNFESNFL